MSVGLFVDLFSCVLEILLIIIIEWRYIKLFGEVNIDLWVKDSLKIVFVYVFEFFILSKFCFYELKNN